MVRDCLDELVAVVLPWSSCRYYTVITLLVFWVNSSNHYNNKDNWGTGDKIVLEGRESGDCRLVATWIDADGRNSGDCRLVTTWIDAVKRSPKSADSRK